MVWRQMRFQIHDPFPSAPVARQQIIQHLSLYIILLLCFLSKDDLLGKGDSHQTLGWFIEGRSTWYPGVG